MQQIAEHYAKPVVGELGTSFARLNDIENLLLQHLVYMDSVLSGPYEKYLSL